MMRVLIVDASSQDRDLAARYLQSANHTVSLASDSKGGLLAIDRDPPEVIVVDAAVAGMSVVQFIQKVRAKEQKSRAYILVVSVRSSPTELSAAITAGADDYMRKPLQREELVIRVGALERIRGWAAQVFTSGKALDLSASTDLLKLHAWQAVDVTITKDIGELMGRSLTPGPCAENGCASVVAAQIPLTLASEQVEVRLTVGVDSASATQLGELCLGDPSAPIESLRDVIREFANTAGGAFIRAAAAEGVSLTCGLPVDLPAGAQESTASARQVFVVSPRDSTMRVVFELDILAKSLRRVNVGQLSEGMVLARDLHTESGALLVPAGTRLTSSQIERMSRILSARVTFDVAEAA